MGIERAAHRKGLDASGRHQTLPLVVSGLDEAIRPGLEAEPVKDDELRLHHPAHIAGGGLELVGILTQRHDGPHLHPLSPDLPDEIGDDGEGGEHIDFGALLRLCGGEGEEQCGCGCEEVAAGDHGVGPGVRGAFV